MPSIDTSPNSSSNTFLSNSVKWISLPNLRSEESRPYGSPVGKSSPAAGKIAAPKKQDTGDEASVLPERTITLFKLIAMTCAAVAGGPYGFEDCIGAGGPYLTLVALLTIPFFWSFPMALMTAELSCMMPDNGGHVLWVDKAFGPFWSFQNSYWTLLQAIFEGGLYPVMFMDYISHLMAVELTVACRLMIGLLMIASVALINIYGADVVGSASVVFTAISISPFLGMMFWGLSKVDLAGTFRAQTDVQIHWPLFITILLWNTSGYDLIGACAGEVKNPAANFPKALLSSMVFTVALNLTILFVGVSMLPDYTMWQDGTFVLIAEKLGGRPLALLFTVGAAVNVVGLLCTLLCVASRIVYGMAKVGTLPRVFAATHPRYHTPHVAMGSMAVLMAFTTALPFPALAQAEMWFYSLTTILKFGALVHLRWSHPDSARPYRIPLGTRGLGAFVTIPILCCVVLVVLSDRQTQFVGLGGVILSLIAYFVGSRTAAVKSDQLVEYIRV
eukprot:jgi/Mesen1/4719/ME000241S03766